MYNHLIYTNCLMGIDSSAGGFQNLTYSENLKKETINFINSSFCSYEVPSNLKRQPSKKEILSMFPKSYRYYIDTEGNKYYVISRYLGMEVTSKRFGNFVTEVFWSKDTNEKYPVEYFYDSNIFDDEFSIDNYIKDNTIIKLTGNENFSLGQYSLKLLKKFIIKDRESVFIEMLAALIKCLDSNKQLVIFDEHKYIIEWVAALTYILPYDISSNITFDTYPSSPRIQKESIIGIFDSNSKIYGDMYKDSNSYYVFNIPNKISNIKYEECKFLKILLNNTNELIFDRIEFIKKSFSKYANEDLNVNNKLFIKYLEAYYSDDKLSKICSLTEFAISNNDANSKEEAFNLIVSSFRALNMDMLKSFINLINTIAYDKNRLVVNKLIINTLFTENFTNECVQEITNMFLHMHRPFNECVECLGEDGNSFIFLDVLKKNIIINDEESILMLFKIIDFLLNVDLHDDNIIVEITKMIIFSFKELDDYEKKTILKNTKIVYDDNQTINMILKKICRDYDFNINSLDNTKYFDTLNNEDYCNILKDLYDQKSSLLFEYIEYISNVKSKLDVANVLVKFNFTSHELSEYIDFFCLTIIDMNNSNYKDVYKLFLNVIKIYQNTDYLNDFKLIYLKSFNPLFISKNFCHEIINIMDNVDLDILDSGLKDNLDLIEFISKIYLEFDSNKLPDIYLENKQKYTFYNEFVESLSIAICANGLYHLIDESINRFGILFAVSTVSNLKVCINTKKIIEYFLNSLIVSDRFNASQKEQILANCMFNNEDATTDALQKIIKNIEINKYTFIKEYL